MLCELLSLSNYGYFNISLATIIGLEPAIYVGELINLNEKALRKEKLENNFFRVDRSYIQKRTTLTSEKQRDIDVALLRIGILEKHPEKSNYFALNTNVITTLVSSPDEKMLKAVSTIGKKCTAKRTKHEMDVEALLMYVIEPDEILKELYSGWIDSVVTKDGWMSKVSVTEGQRYLHNFSQGNKDIERRVLEIASINGHRDMNWSIQRYVADTGQQLILTPQQKSAPIARKRLGDEVF